MKELSKSALRRSHDPAFLQHYFSGRGLDICGSGDSLNTFIRWFPRTQEITPWRKSLSDLQDVPGVDEQSYDFVHASHRFQLLSNPQKALARWLDLVKPGGYVVFTVPDEDFLSSRNTVVLTTPGDTGAHSNSSENNRNTRFTIHKPEQESSTSRNVLDIARTFSRVASCERIALIRDNYEDGQQNEEPDTRRFAECVIEVVLRKREAPSIHDLLGRATRSQSADECLRTCREAIDTYPYRFQAYHRSIILLQRWNLVSEMDDVLTQATERLAGEWNPLLYQMLHYIKSERLNEGFRMREKLFGRTSWQRRSKAPPPANTPAWTGQSLKDKSIAIWSEFGLGDEIFFLRFARMLREQAGAARVTVVCQAPLLDLFKASGEADDVVSVDVSAEMPSHDYWIYPHAIPAYLALDMANLPKSVPYLRVSGPAELPGRAHALKVGIVFKGAPSHENDQARSLKSLSILDTLFAHQEIDFYSLQKGPGADEAAEYAKRLPNFHDVGAGVTTMDETAEAVKALDVLLTVDTSVAHVAGALGTPTWLLLPFYSDWRWHYERKDSPWYPTMRLFRQQFGADWSEVIARVNGHLLTLQDERYASGGTNHEAHGVRT